MPESFMETGSFTERGLSLGMNVLQKQEWKASLLWSPCLLISSEQVFHPKRIGTATKFIFTGKQMVTLLSLRDTQHMGCSSSRADVLGEGPGQQLSSFP